MEKVYALFYTLFSWAEKLHFLHCSGLFFHFWLLRSCAIYHCKNIIKNGTKPISFRCHFFTIFLLPPSPRLWQPKTSPPLEAFLTHAHMEIFSSPPLRKMWCPWVIRGAVDFGSIDDDDESNLFLFAYVPYWLITVVCGLARYYCNLSTREAKMGQSITVRCTCHTCRCVLQPQYNRSSQRAY